MPQSTILTVRSSKPRTSSSIETPSELVDQVASHSPAGMVSSRMLTNETLLGSMPVLDYERIER